MPKSQRPRSVAALAVIALVLATSMSHYTVQPGDTISQIALEHGTTVSDIVDRNDLGSADFIYVGQQLDIPGVSGGQGGIVPLEPTSISHLVSPGETLASIAGRYGTTSEALMALNGITNPNLIFAGTMLLVSGTPPSALPEVGTGGSSYVVQAGDTLSEIASAFGVSVADIIAANGLSNADFIRIGQELAVGTGAAGFRCPVPGSTFFNDYGFPRSGGRWHEGNDLFAPRGTPVLAPVSGYVHHLVGSLGGNQFRLDGDDGHRYIGTHMDSFGISGNVQAGDVVGFVGDSGNAMGSDPHLHFEVHLDRTTPTNPYPLLEAACR